MSGSTIVIKPQQNTNPDRLGHAFKECFTNKDITIESNIIIQMIEREVQSEKSRYVLIMQFNYNTFVYKWQNRPTSYTGTGLRITAGHHNQPN